MARKRVVKKQKVSTKTEPPKTPPLMTQEGQFFQELVNASNRYADLMKQEAQYKFIITRLEMDRKKIQHEEIHLPVQLTLIPNLMTYQEHDKKKVLAIFDEQIKSYNSNIQTLKGQMEHRYEDYLEYAARNKEFLSKRFQNVKAKSIVPLRDVGEKDEEVLFEAEFKDLKDSAEKKEQLKAAQKEAIKRNVARKKKTVCKCKSCTGNCN